MKVCDIIDAHFKGDLEHMADTLSLIWRTVNQAGGNTTTPDSKSSVRLLLVHLGVRANSDFRQPKHITSPVDWNWNWNWSILQTAMMKSIREGVFFDQKYWVRHLRKGSGLKAVYFSSMIIGNGLKACE